MLVVTQPNSHKVFQLNVSYALTCRGKFGEVKRCREKLTGREFAAKFIPCTPQDKKEVQNEIVIMKKLHHRRIIQLYEAYATDRETCLVLEMYVYRL